MSCVILATNAPAFEQRVRSALEGGLNGALQVLPRGPVPTEPADVLAHVVGADVPDVVVLGHGLPFDDAMLLAERFDAQCPGITVVLVWRSDSDIWKAAMRAGVRDVLDPDADVDEIRVVLERAIHAAEAHRRVVGVPVDSAAPAGRIITVASAKGGTGKTTVSTNLAVGLARLHPESTVLVDLDVQFGDVASALQLNPDHTLTDAVSGPASLDAMVLKTFLEVHATGLYTLCAPHLPTGSDEISGEQISRLLDLLAANFAYVVVDTAPGIGDHALAALDRATDIVQVCGMDVPSVRGLRKELEVLAELGIKPGSCTVLLNFADRNGGLTVADVELAIGRPVDFVLPPAKSVPLSTNHGVPLLQNDQKDPVTKQLSRLVAQYVDPAVPKPAKASVQQAARVAATTARDAQAPAAKPVVSTKAGSGRGQPEHAKEPRRWFSRSVAH